MVTTQHFPQTIQAGISLRAELRSEAYPAGDWIAQAHLRGPSMIDLTATAQDRAHLFYVPYTQTGAWAPGVYDYVVKVSNETDAFVLERAQLRIEADATLTQSPYDARKHEVRVLEAVEAVLENRATKDQESYTINGRSLVRTPIGDLLKLRDYYKSEVAKMTTGGRRRRLLGRQLKVRF